MGEINDPIYKKAYIGLKGSGMFWEWFPSMTGVWSEDKERFIKEFEKWKIIKGIKD